MGRKGIKKVTKKFDVEFRYLLDIDPNFEDWRALASEWCKEHHDGKSFYSTPLSKFFSEYVHDLKLDKRPIALLDAAFAAPSLRAALNLDAMARDGANRMHDHISDFINWVIKEKLSPPNADGFPKVPTLLRNPFQRVQAKKLALDTEFRYLLEIDPKLEEWRRLAAEWCGEKGRNHNCRNSLAKFFKEYLHGLGLDKSPQALLDAVFAAPPLREALNFDAMRPKGADKINDHISDFIDWALREKFSVADVDGFRKVPAHLRNPFTRTQKRIVGKRSDVKFHYILDLDPRMTEWRDLAHKWLNSQRINFGGKRAALDIFFSQYLIKHDLERNPYKFLRREYPKPDFFDSVMARKGDELTVANYRAATPGDIKFNNCIHDFLAWVLVEKLSVDDDNGNVLVPHEFHNPVQKRQHNGRGLAETLKTPLPYRYIRELRSNLAQGQNFCNWTWAQQAIDKSGGGGDWFVVDASLIDEGDRDCVFRKRLTSRYEQKRLHYPPEVIELWSPVRAMALYLKLELPLRTFQVRMLDSGEADTWRYDSGKWLLNISPLALGSEKRPSQRGVFHRSTSQEGAGFYINTNKTADIDKDENSKGYIIPWTYEPVLYWLEKLRNWQENYNSIASPTPWRDLEGKHFGATTPHPSALEERGASCFLFRNAAGTESDRCKPICAGNVSRLWHLLLADLEKRCEAKGETLDDGSPIRFVDPEREHATYFPLHALRVSLITAYALEGSVPFPVLSKLIAGHARIIMTLYYTKAGKVHVTEVMQEAEKRVIENEKASCRRFLMEQSYREIEKRYAFNSPDALKAVSQQGSAVGFIFEDKGICPVGGGMCDIGGGIQKECKTDPSKNQYAPVSGYPQERNCIRCRFFLTGPAFLPGLQAHFNWVSYKATECAERYARLEAQVMKMEDARMACEERGTLFTQRAELERLSRYYEEEAERANKLLTDFQSVVRLIEKCISIINSTDQDGVRLVATGGVSDIKYALCETESELYQLEVICEDAVIYPEIDAGKATLRRSQILDAMLQMSGRPPIFFRLDKEQQLRVGNEVMKLIQARTGSIKDATEFAECRRTLSNIGLLDETVSLIEKATAGVAFRQVIDSAQSEQQINDQIFVQGDGCEP